MAESASYTAIIKEDSGWWIGWIEEIPGVNSQGESRDELIENLKSALSEALDFNREEALAAARGSFVEARITL